MRYYYLAYIGDKTIKEEKMYYFDNNSTTLIYSEKVKKEINYWLSCGNPSNALHQYGRKSNNAKETARHQLAKILHVVPKEIFFTSGATESNNIIIQGIVKYHKEQSKSKEEKFRIITSSFEHPSVIKVCQHYEKTDERIEVSYVSPVQDKTSKYYNRIDPKDIEIIIKKSKEKIILMTIMHGNNETGAMQDIEVIGKIAKKNEIFFHTDATQAIGKFKLKPKEWGIDALSFSGHKFHGPKGIGGLYLKHDCNKILSLCFGGEQEREIRPGTENIACITGMAMALTTAHQDREKKNIELRKKTAWIEKKLKEKLNIRILGPDKDHKLPHTMLTLFKDMGSCNKMFVKALDKRKICVSVGSACQTKSAGSSHVLDTLDIDVKDKIKIIRISLSDYTTMEECEYLVDNLIELVKEKK